MSICKQTPQAGKGHDGEKLFSEGRRREYPNQQGIASSGVKRGRDRDGAGKGRSLRVQMRAKREGGDRSRSGKCICKGNRRVCCPEFTK